MFGSLAAAARWHEFDAQVSGGVVAARQGRRVPLTETPIDAEASATTVATPEPAAAPVAAPTASYSRAPRRAANRK